MSPASRRPTSSDVASRAGVSRATVSMVLNNRIEGTVAPATRERVLAAASELGYARSAIALSLRSQSTRTIGIVTDEIATSPWAGRMVRAAAAAADARDYMTLTVDLSLRSADPAQALQVLAERQADAVLFATMGRTIVSLPKIPGALPLVLLNCEQAKGDDDRYPSVQPDDLEGARRAARRLLDVGHREIVMLSGDDRQLATLQREQGFAREMESAGLPVRILRCGWQMSDGYRAVAEGFDGSVPTAVFCIRDRVAAGVIHGAAVQGLSVPGDLSVIGFDDEDFFAEHLTPALTTIALPHERMGEIAMTELLDVLDGAALGARTQLVACPLVERDTVANPATRS